MTKSLAKYLAPCAENRINIDNCDFSDYVQRCIERIEKCRVFTSGDNQEKIIRANSPKEFIPAKPASAAVLLIHGLSDSPHSLASVFDNCCQQGYFTRSVLLPGHGTRPGDLLTVNAEDWQRTVSFAIESFPSDLPLFIVGLSTGAVLALRAVLDGHKVRGLIHFAPAYRIKSRLAGLTRGYRLWRYLSERLMWFKAWPETDYAKYQALSFNVIAELYNLANTTVADYLKQKPDIAQFTVLSSADEVIDTTTCLELFSQNPNSNQQLWLYGTKKTFADKRIIQRSGQYPKDNVIDLSHFALSNAPTHPHYGANGDYQDFSHYQGRYGERLRKRAKNLPNKLGAINWHNLNHYYLQRSCYNPDFSHLMNAINEFIHQHG